jgi:RHS repeat-associated protein
MKKHLSILVMLLFASIHISAQQFSNENFIYSESPQIPVQVGNYGSLSATDIAKNIKYFDGLGRLKQTIDIGQTPVSNLLDWKNSWSIGSGGVPGFIQNGKTSENIRIDGLNPFGKTSRLWRCVNDASSDADGGWGTAGITIDKTKSYLYAVWVKRTGGQSGTTYHGTQNVVTLSGEVDTNPYFWYGNLPQLDTWYLMVGLIHPSDYTGGNSGISGVYDINGVRVPIASGQGLACNEFKWSNTTTDSYFRSYLYYSTDINVSQYFYNPILQKIDGNQFNISGLLKGIEASDIITPVEYDRIGRQAKEYFPYAASSTGGLIKTNALTDVLSYYYTTKYENTTNPFSQKAFEESPLNRVLQQAAAGNDWAMANNHTIKMDYQTNGLNEVKLYSATTLVDGAGVYNPTIASSSNYDVGQLYKTITKDENWTSSDGKNKTTEEFKDKEGRVVLKRSYSNIDFNSDGDTNDPGESQVPLDTYYVYDIYGNLSFVLPPKSEGVITNAVLNDLCYQYKYDYRNRLLEKKLPGKDWEYIVYDKLDRPILTQEANLRVSNRWLFTKYDAFNRPVYTGEYVNASNTTRAAIQLLADTSTTLFETKQGVNTINGTTVYYSNSAFPNVIDANSSINLFTINYYDNYSFDLNGGAIEASYGVTPITNVKSLATGSKIRILGTSAWITNVIYYDAKGRPIYNYTQNDYLATTAKVKSSLDFVGKTLETTSSHTRSAVTTNIVDTFVYDHAGRLLSQKQKVNTQTEEIILANTYDELGQLTSKGVGGKTTQGRLQNIDYSYNIRGWLRNINNVDAIGTDLFAFRINYNGITAGVTPLFNGNISQTQWKTANDPLANAPRNYSYAYDALNRLTAATDNTAISPNRYNEILTYDKNGNIKNLKRSGNTDLNATTFGTMDNLTYTYDTGNKLTKVEDGGSTEGFNNGSSGSLIDYSYDPNGNMTKDFNKGIGNSTTDGITYNYLNLPTEVKFNNDNNNKINYIYDAVGTKQKKIVTKNGVVTQTSYAGGFIYEKVSSGTDDLKFFGQPEGYVEPNGSSFKYVYQYKDHLGNIRLSYKDVSLTSTPSLQIEEENNYYPFGLKQKGYNVGTPSTNTALKYKYNGKELQDELGLGVYDYGARNYDPALGRWMNIDPLAEKSRRFSPYTYALNNPVFFIDPDGMEAMSPIYGSKGQYLGTDSQGFKGEVIFMNENMFSLLNFGQKEGGISHNMAMKFGETLPSVIGNSKDSFTQGESDMVNNAITDIVSKTDDKGFDMSNLHNSKTSSDFTAPDRTTDKANQYWGPSSNDASQPVFGKDEVPATTKGNVMTFNLYSSYLNKKGEFTVGNIQNAAVHEGGHLTGNIPGEGTEHAKAYELQMNHSTWQQSTPLWRINLTRAYKEVKAGNL